MQTRHVLILVAGLVVGARLLAQDEAAESEPIVIESGEAAQESEPAEDSGAADARAADEDEDRFVPSAEVPPNEQVIFPIDI